MHGYLMKSEQFGNVKLRMPKATLRHSTPKILEFQATQGGIVPTLKLVGAQVEMLHDPSCFMSNKIHISTEPKKSQLGNKRRVVAIVRRLAIGTRSVLILQENMYQPEAYHVMVRHSISAHLHPELLLLLSTLHDCLT